VIRVLYRVCSARMQSVTYRPAELECEIYVKLRSSPERQAFMRITRETCKINVKRTLAFSHEPITADNGGFPFE